MKPFGVLLAGATSRRLRGMFDAMPGCGPAE